MRINTTWFVLGMFLILSLGCAETHNRSGSTPDSIKIQHPRPRGEISSPLRVSGKARGSWYVEGQFSFRVVTDSGKKLAEGLVSSQSNWMTDDFVPFRGSLHFERPAGTETGQVIFESANPSGKPELQKTAAVEVRFASSDAR